MYRRSGLLVREIDGSKISSVCAFAFHAGRLPEFPIETILCQLNSAFNDNALRTIFRRTVIRRNLIVFVFNHIHVEKRPCKTRKMTTSVPVLKIYFRKPKFSAFPQQ